ncbi:hypothetical protein TrST_g610 [Triparma strigata]|uniref:Uncharacterized protein n=1 Tax=Triparma strigata TaxID=1606541 RepID=A0A9W7EL14_9STRA|nr:hypothetical protein TrST_g610 [Triparma strigata]
MISLATATAMSPSNVNAATTPSLPTTAVNPVLLDLVSVPPSLRNSIAAYSLPGCTVTCISLPSTRSQSVSLSVPTGSTSQPLTLRGLPHFCEHMLFLGTKKYPNSLESYLSQITGSSNAYTEPEFTTYYMSSVPDFNAVDRLLHFLIDPTFTLDSVSKEVNAVSSEHTKNLQSDVFRISELQKLRLNPNHPASNFFTGNTTTLLYNGQEYLRDNLEAWYGETYISPDRSKSSVVYISPLPLKQMSKDVLEALKTLPPISSPPSSCNFPSDRVSPFQDPVIGQSKILKISPVTDVSQLSLSFPIPYGDASVKERYTVEKPLDYVSFVLGHEGAGSLAKKLKDMNWVTNLAVGTSDEISDYCSLDVNVDLTAEGMKNYKKIIPIIFSYVNMMKSRPIPDHCINESVIMGDLGWYYFTVTSPENYATSLSNSMLKYCFKPELGLVGDMRMGVRSGEGLGEGLRDGLGFAGNENVRELVKDAMQYVSVDNVRVDLLTKDVEKESSGAWQYEEIYGTKYTTEDITSAMKKEWRDAKIDGVNYPEVNGFIPSKASLKFVNEGADERKVGLSPEKVDAGDGGAIWYKPDLKFKKPKSLTALLIRNKNLHRTSKGVALSNIYENAIQRKFNEFLYDANLAGKSFTVLLSSKGLSITVGGWDGELLKFWESCLVKLKDFKITEEEFKSSRDEILKNSKQFDYAQPYSLASYYTGLIFDKVEDRKDVYSVRSEIGKVGFDDFRKFGEGIWEGEPVMLTQGNFDYDLRDEPGRKYYDVFNRVFSERGGGGEKYVQPVVNVIKDEVRIKVKNPNPQNFNAATNLVMQAKNVDTRSNLMMEIACAVLGERFYEELRTVKQLGYVVNLGCKALGDGRGVVFTVMSGEYGSPALEKAIEEFLNSSGDILSKVGDAEFKRVVQGLGERKSESDKRLGQEFMRNWAEIVSQKLTFDRRENEVKILPSIKKDEVVNVWKEMVESGEGRVWASIVPSNGKIKESVNDVIEGSVFGKMEIDGLRAELEA